MYPCSYFDLCLAHILALIICAFLPLSFCLIRMLMSMLAFVSYKIGAKWNHGFAAKYIFE